MAPRYTAAMKATTLFAVLLIGCGIETQQTPATSPDPATLDPPASAEVSSQPAGQLHRVIGIIDGDTIDVLADGKQLRLRLAGIDAPERGQPFGRSAKQQLSDRIAGRSVRVVITDTDRYGRSIADVFDDDGHLNRWLVERGLAWHYVKYSDSAELAAAESSARSAGRGLWSDPRHVAPWDWRRLSKSERDQLR
ncbi:MAG: hypothetical protein Fues2KO_45600 [Fuerstiella sp.]